ncbi:MAG TPA: flagellar hook-associated protein FlgK, partial [Polyangiaceae bacterium]
GSSLGQLFSSFSALAANPNDTTTRQSVLDSAGAFAQRANDTAASISQMQSDLRQQAQGTIDDVNQRAKDIAKLDLQIAQAESQGQDAADLKDQRDQKLLDMSSLIDVHTFTDGQGNLVVQSAGTTLIDGSHAGQLSLGAASDGSLQILTADPSGSTADVTKYLTGGKLAGIRDARDVDLFDVSKQLDQLVFDVATAVNTQHAAGTGTDGGTGRNLFDVGANSSGAAAAVHVSADVLGHPERVAAALSSTSLPGGSDNAAALSALSTSFFANGNSETAAQAYGDIVGHVGQLRADSKRDVETQTAVFQQAQSMQQSLSGVSLDEEMVALTKYQNAYQAASKVLTTVDQLLATLMDAVGR